MFASESNVASYHMFYSDPKGLIEIKNESNLEVFLQNCETLRK